MEWPLAVLVLRSARDSAVPKKAARYVLYLHYGCLMLVKELMKKKELQIYFSPRQFNLAKWRAPYNSNAVILQSTKAARK